MSIIEKYNIRADKANSLLCVGLDSKLESIPQRFQRSDTPQFAFNKWITEQTHSYVAAYKPNIAFYEARGAQGLTELKLTMQYIKEHHPDIFTICDAKRADIGNTNLAYTTAIFDEMGFDAITLHPYLGREALAPFLDRKDKCSIILCHTSNPGAEELQGLQINGKPLWQIVAEKVSNEWNDNDNCMLVVGATYPETIRQVREIVGDMTFLIPGIGAQGGDVESTVKAGSNSQGLGMIINSSRGIIFSDDPKVAAMSLRDAINQHR
jgi:orotidine-5'-phosphate decarboxylase